MACDPSFEEAPLERSPTIWELWRRSLVVRLPFEYTLQGILVVLVALAVLLWTMLAPMLLSPRGAGFTISAQAGLMVAVVALWFSPRLLLFGWRFRELQRLIRLEAGARLCARCGYSRDNLPDDRVCPECGKPFESAIQLRRRIYGLAPAVPGLEEIPSAEVAATLRRLVLIDRVLSWPRMLAVAGALVIITLLVALTFELVYFTLGVEVARSVKLVPLVAIPLVFVFALAQMKIGHVERGMNRFVRSTRGDAHSAIAQ